MSLDPAMYRTSGNVAVSPGAAADHAACDAELARARTITRAEVVSLTEGDRLIVHIDGAAGMSAGGAHEAGLYVRAALKLDELPYDVPVLIVSPGIQVTVARPG